MMSPPSLSGKGAGGLGEFESDLVLMSYEHRLISIIKRLPPHCVSQVINFAKFLEFEIIRNRNDILTDETEEEIAESNARWDALLATDESQRLLEKMADEALAEIQAGRTRPIAFTDDGRIVSRRDEINITPPEFRIIG